MTRCHITRILTHACTSPARWNARLANATARRETKLAPKNGSPGCSTSFGKTGITTPIPKISRNQVMKMNTIASFGKGTAEI